MLWLAESHPRIQRDLQYFSVQDTGDHAGESLGTQCVMINNWVGYHNNYYKTRHYNIDSDYH